MPTSTKSVTERVLEVVYDDPGVSVEHIRERLGNRVSGKKISNSLAYLRRIGKIVNLGKAAKGASWYPKD